MSHDPVDRNMPVTSLTGYRDLQVRGPRFFTSILVSETATLLRWDVRIFGEIRFDKLESTALGNVVRFEPYLRSPPILVGGHEQVAENWTST